MANEGDPQERNSDEIVSDETLSSGNSMYDSDRIIREHLERVANNCIGEGSFVLIKGIEVPAELNDQDRISFVLMMATYKTIGDNLKE